MEAHRINSAIENLTVPELHRIHRADENPIIRILAERLIDEWELMLEWHPKIDKYFALEGEHETLKENYAALELKHDCLEDELADAVEKLECVEDNTNTL